MKQVILFIERITLMSEIKVLTGNKVPPAALAKQKAGIPLHKALAQTPKPKSSVKV